MSRKYQDENHADDSAPEATSDDVLASPTPRHQPRQPQTELTKVAQSKPLALGSKTFHTRTLNMSTPAEVRTVLVSGPLGTAADARAIHQTKGHENEIGAWTAGAACTVSGAKVMAEFEAKPPHAVSLEFYHRTSPESAGTKVGTLAAAGPFKPGLTLTAKFKPFSVGVGDSIAVVAAPGTVLGTFVITIACEAKGA